MDRGARIDVLDHGYVRFIEPWGTGLAGTKQTEYDYECGIVEAARQSTQGSFRGWATDEKLLRHLYTSTPRHAGPFEFAGLVLEVQAPLMVFREWHRHRTQSYNEMSARYAPLPELYYHCHIDLVLHRAQRAAEEKNKQAAAAAPVDAARIMAWVARDLELENLLEAHYQEGLGCGVPKELARKKMPVDHYSRHRCAANLRNWLAFMTLRADPAAQWEIRQYAHAVGTILDSVFPQTWKLYTEGRV